MSRVFRPAVRAPLRFHDLRHTHAALMVAAGAHPKLLQAQLGHTSINVTLNTYGPNDLINCSARCRSRVKTYGHAQRGRPRRNQPTTAAPTSAGRGSRSSRLPLPRTTSSP